MAFSEARRHEFSLFSSPPLSVNESGKKKQRISAI